MNFQMLYEAKKTKQRRFRVLNEVCSTIIFLLQQILSLSLKAYLHFNRNKVRSKLEEKFGTNEKGKKSLSNSFLMCFSVLLFISWHLTCSLMAGFQLL